MWNGLAKGWEDADPDLVPEVAAALAAMSYEEAQRRAVIVQWLTEQGETLDSLKALVELIDEEREKDSGPRTEYVADLQYQREICTCDGDDSDPGDETAEDVPLGGLSHEDAHGLIEGIRGVIGHLRSASAAWPDDGRRAAAELERLLK